MKRLANLFWTAIGVMLFAIFATNLIDRYTGNDTAYSFYSEPNDATCIVTRERGQPVMFCMEGDRREVKP